MTVLITDIHLKQFRCFDTLSLHFEQPIVIIQGSNGSGKTSLLEALHYCCYLRSFRTHISKELIAFSQQSFFIKLRLTHDAQSIHDIQVGYSGKKKQVKVDERTIDSYKDLNQYYGTITLTEDDLFLIKGGPEHRRHFLDQAITLYNADYLTTLKRYRHILDQRNALLSQGNVSTELYMLWTQQLQEQSYILQQLRCTFLDQLEQKVNELLKQWFLEDLYIKLAYQSKNEVGSELHSLECRYGRTLFGAHLDDFSIQLSNTYSRAYASRGQQKLIVLLLKIAQIYKILEQSRPVILLLDDFITDFDPQRAATFIRLLTSLPCQLIFTSPSQDLFQSLLGEQSSQNIKLTN